MGRKRKTNLIYMKYQITNTISILLFTLTILMSILISAYGITIISFLGFVSCWFIPKFFKEDEKKIIEDPQTKTTIDFKNKDFVRKIIEYNEDPIPPSPVQEDKKEEPKIEEPKKEGYKKDRKRKIGKGEKRLASKGKKNS